MAKTKIIWHDEGFHEILNSPGMYKLCEDAGKAIAANATANAGTSGEKKSKPEFNVYSWHSNMKGGRAAAIVSADNYAAKEAEATKKALSSAAASTRL